MFLLTVLCRPCLSLKWSVGWWNYAEMWTCHSKFHCPSIHFICNSFVANKHRTECVLPFGSTKQWHLVNKRYPFLLFLRTSLWGIGRLPAALNLTLPCPFRVRQPAFSTFFLDGFQHLQHCSVVIKLVTNDHFLISIPNNWKRFGSKCATDKTKSWWVLFEHPLQNVRLGCQCMETNLGSEFSMWKRHAIGLCIAATMWPRSSDRENATLRWQCQKLRVTHHE